MRPIIFSGPMVNAILSGDKTQTRRVMTPQPWPDNCYDGATLLWGKSDKKGPCMGYHVHSPHVGKAHPEWRKDCPFGQPGDRLWVREKFAYIAWPRYPGKICVKYAADAQIYTVSTPTPRCATGRWKASIHMPRWASRLTLEVTEVRVERVQDITEDDAWKEGVLEESDHYYCDEGPPPDYFPAHRCDAVGKFHRVWDKINAKRGFGWDVNPWVWVVEFEKV